MSNKKARDVAKWIFIRLPELVAGVALIFAISLTTINAFTRYLLHFTINGSDEYCILAFAWMVFPGCAAAYRRKMHYGIDILVNLIPNRVQPVIKLLAQAVAFVLMIVLTYLGWVLCANVGSKIMTATHISYVVFDSALVVGFGLMSIYALIFLIQDIRALPDQLRKYKEVTK